MTNIDLNNIELKNAEVVANVGDKQISAKVEDKDTADKFEQLRQELRDNSNVSDIKVTEGKDEVQPA